MAIDIGLQIDDATRLLVAAVLGAVIGLEREIHDHPAGMRTHLLVAVGSAAFTVLSIQAFPAPGADPARVAAQVVTGIGFLGAGAILKEGVTVRGLTTAASLWTAAAVGIAAGAAAWGTAIAVTIIVVVSLWPLRLVTERLTGGSRDRLSMVLTGHKPGLVAEIVDVVHANGGSIVHLSTRRGDDGATIVELEVRASKRATKAKLAVALDGLDATEITSSGAIGT